MDELDPDFDYSDTRCPACGHAPTHTRTCAAECDDGLVDEHEEDCINHDPGDYRMCDTCCGHGVEHWCPACGRSLLDARG